ncbi:hypothetical protein [Dokdonella sp.]|uniref:hypothetical protein n=1 Tax=Dokdonella sp. TaxID=2291710 RepID=UPI002F3E56B2
MALAVAIERRSGGLDQDRAAWWGDSRHGVFALADGAGGTSGGAGAAMRVLREARALHRGLHRSPLEALDAVDAALSRSGGQSTAILVELREGVLRGASTGDSRAWLIGGNLIELTRSQRRRPLLGDGGLPVPFGPVALRGRLLLASDGLFDYVDLRAIARTAVGGELASCARALTALPRFADGTFPDDVVVLLAEATPTASR